MATQGPKLDKTAVSVGRLTDPAGDKEYWLSKTPLERLAALEFLRQTVYGYDPTTARLQRVVEIVERSQSCVPVVYNLP